MANKDDWFREPCLSTDAKERFESRLSRSRSSRPEYLRLQAYALREAKAYYQALEMLKRVAANYPNHLTAWIQQEIARCYEALGQYNCALKFYAKSIETMKLDRGLRVSAHTSYASLVVELKRTDLYEGALDHLTEFWDPDPIFPADEMQQFGWTAILLDELGHRLDAMPPARRALVASIKQRSDAANHRKLGLVGDRYSEMKGRLEQIAGSSFSAGSGDARSLVSEIRGAAHKLLRP